MLVSVLWNHKVSFERALGSSHESFLKVQTVLYPLHLTLKSQVCGGQVEHTHAIEMLFCGHIGPSFHNVTEININIKLL